MKCVITNCPKCNLEGEPFCDEHRRDLFKAVDALSKDYLAMTERAEKAEAKLQEAINALNYIGDDIVDPRNEKAVVDTIWHSEIETMIDFIDTTILRLVRS
jgi:hypothetical protein